MAKAEEGGASPSCETSDDTYEPSLARSRMKIWFRQIAANVLASYARRSRRVASL